MKKYNIGFLVFLLIMVINHTHAQLPASTRTEQFSNNQVKVWKTVIYPNNRQALPMHRHHHDRVVVALTNGVLKITTNSGKTHYLKLEKDKAYYLSKDPKHELHTDENMGHSPVKVMVIELKK